MGTLQAVALSDVSGVNRALVTSSGRLAVDPGASSITVDISGDPVNISGNAVNISGNTINTVEIALASTIIRTASGVKCTSVSGGVVFPSLVGDRIIIRANSDNSGRIYLGSTTNPPFSGMGLQLAAGQSESFSVTNANVFQAFASASGDVVSFIAEDIA